jgi:hypothetical protein
MVEQGSGSNGTPAARVRCINVMSFKPAAWTTAANIGTSVVVVAFVVTLFLSFWGGQLWVRLTCPILGAVLIGCWLFSVKGYVVDRGAISLEHPLWSDRFEVRGLVREDRRPGKDSIRLLASNWIFGHTLGLCYNRKVGTFFVYITNPGYRLDVETNKGVLTISPVDRAGLSSALSGSTETQQL